MAFCHRSHRLWVIIVDVFSIRGGFGCHFLNSLFLGRQCPLQWYPYPSPAYQGSIPTWPASAMKFARGGPLCIWTIDDPQALGADAGRCSLLQVPGGVLVHGWDSQRDAEVHCKYHLKCVCMFILVLSREIPKGNRRDQKNWQLVDCLIELACYEVPFLPVFEPHFHSNWQLSTNVDTRLNCHSHAQSRLWTQICMCTCECTHTIYLQKCPKNARVLPSPKLSFVQVFTCALLMDLCNQVFLSMVGTALWDVKSAGTTWLYSLVLVGCGSMLLLCGVLLVASPSLGTLPPKSWWWCVWIVGDIC